MSNDNAGRSPRSTSGNAPMGSTIAIVVTAVAVVLGFLILRKINDGGDDGSSVAPQTTLETTATLDPNATTTIQFTAPPTTPPLVTTGTKVQVANASNAGGTARQMSTALAGKGFDMAEPTNATVDPKLDATKVIYDQNDPNALNVANSVALVLGGVAVEPAPRRHRWKPARSPRAVGSSCCWATTWPARRCRPSQVNPPRAPRLRPRLPRAPRPAADLYAGRRLDATRAGAARQWAL